MSKINKTLPSLNLNHHCIPGRVRPVGEGLRRGPSHPRQRGQDSSAVHGGVVAAAAGRHRRHGAACHGHVQRHLQAAQGQEEEQETGQ